MNRKEYRVIYKSVRNQYLIRNLRIANDDVARFVEREFDGAERFVARKIIAMLDLHGSMADYLSVNPYTGKPYRDEAIDYAMYAMVNGSRRIFPDYLPFSLVRLPSGMARKYTRVSGLSLTRFLFKSK